jgi:SAM-dependent methyltransferase
MNVVAYRLGAAVHWRPREEALRDALHELARNASLAGVRLVDVGAGLGQLAAVAEHFGCDYVGIEPDDAMRHFAQTHHPGRVFLLGSARDLPGLLTRDDVLVLNGVVHHMADRDFDEAVRAGGCCRAVVVCDHWRMDGRIGALTRWLQDHDEGRHIRPYAVFERLPGLRLAHHRFFFIGPFGTRLWTYFCNTYLPER